MTGHASGILYDQVNAKGLLTSGKKTPSIYFKSYDRHSFQKIHRTKVGFQKDPRMSKSILKSRWKTAASVELVPSHHSHVKQPKELTQDEEEDQHRRYYIFCNPLGFLRLTIAPAFTFFLNFFKRIRVRSSFFFAGLLPCFQELSPYCILHRGFWSVH